MPEADFDEERWRNRIESYRREKEAFLADHPDSPLADTPAAVERVGHYPLDPEYRVVARFQPVDDPAAVALSMTRGPDREYERAATFGFVLNDDHCVLTGYRAVGEKSLFVPFTDATSGDETPGFGRFLDVTVGDADLGDQVVLDFNLATLPFAALDSEYVSAVPPAENHVSTAMCAGERLVE